jgi:hypothetical protein
MTLLPTHHGLNPVATTQSTSWKAAAYAMSAASATSRHRTLSAAFTSNGSGIFLPG